MFRANIYGLLDGGMVTLQLCCWKFSHKETVADFIRFEIEFYLEKKQKIASLATFGGLRGNIHTPSIAHWKAHGRLPIHHN